VNARPSDNGAGSVLVLSVAAALLLFTGLLVPLYIGLAAKRTVAGAADAAALAAADALSGAVPGFPCELGERVARLNGASLASCRIDGSDVIVEATGEVLGLPIRAAARAGPLPESGGHAGQSPGSD
jgi:secretion/DNA translocation related TadE-like protein